MKPFNVRATFWLRPDRVFRVYTANQDIFFIRIGGQAVNWVAALAQLGPLGIWLGRKLDARRNRILQSRAAEADRIPPQVQLNKHSHNFRVGLSDITAAHFEPGRQISLHGPYAAKWRLTLRSGQQWDFIFEHAGEAHQAFEELGTALGDRLVADVAWDESKGQFRKTEMSSRAPA